MLYWALCIRFFHSAHWWHFLENLLFFSWGRCCFRNQFWVLWPWPDILRFLCVDLEYNFLFLWSEHWAKPSNYHNFQTIFLYHSWCYSFRPPRVVYLYEAIAARIHACWSLLRSSLASCSFISWAAYLSIPLSTCSSSPPASSLLSRLLAELFTCLALEDEMLRIWRLRHDSLAFFRYSFWSDRRL